MKNKLSPALVVSLLVFIAFIVQPCALGQQKQQAGPSATTSTGRGSPGWPGSGRRATRNNSSAIPLIQKDLQEALRVIEAQYVEGKELDYDLVFKSSILGMLRSLDPHSNYYDREEYEELKTEQRSEYFGIGASIQNYVIGEKLDTYVTATFKDSPAWRAGLRFGDKIVAVNGVKMTGKPSLDVRNRIRGPRGSLVRITVERGNDNQSQIFEITRDAVSQPSVPDAYLLRPGLGYIDMTRGFNYTTSDELQTALDELRAKGATSLVLDLRNNPGGFLDQAIRVAEVFLPYGQLILTQKGRNGLRDNVYVSRNRTPDQTPLVILINENTASASEIVAGAMQDHDRALIVGETSFGKGLVQSIIPLDQGGGLTLTSAKYYTPSGRLIQRDYSENSLYDYYTQGGSRRNDGKNGAKPAGAEKRTDHGRTVYGGGGITPDENVDARTVTLGQRRLLSPLFAFSRVVAGGRIPSLSAYRIPGTTNFSHELQPVDFIVGDPLLKAFGAFLENDPALASLVPLVQRNRSFVQLQLRYNLVTAAYGRQMGDRVYITTDDPQVTTAINLVPRAKDLAMATPGRK